MLACELSERCTGDKQGAYSYVSGGLAIAIPHGPGVPYNYNNNCAPTVGIRFAI